ncbi:M24 family metallopeptidase [Micromonospora sp. SL1-18]|uniref:M24 family metallopeptidase n=1 Tax=Micromonospora sp. SL1-18 TaxID=3399128 RepID=UPI003A4D7EFF
MTDDLGEKLVRLGALAERRGLDTLVLREQASISWLTGARSHVPQTLDTSCLDLVVHFGGAGPAGPGKRAEGAASTGRPASLTAVANAIEAPRLRDTELADLPLDWTVVPWWEDRSASLPTGASVGSDRPGPDMVDVRADLAAVRRQLTIRQAETLAAVCADAAAATTAAIRRCSLGMTEYEAAGLLTEELLARALDPVVLMVAADRRGAAHRHPLPTTAPITDRVMLVCCGRRDGLIASVTRFRCFQPPTSAERDTYRRLLEVEAAFLDATRVGTSIGRAFAAGTAAYAANGFDTDEWHRHHQGGFSGWQPREYPAHSGSTDPITDNSVVAWNPSGEGWKVEDACLVTPAGPRLLVEDADWPTVIVAGRRRPDLFTG